MSRISQRKGALGEKELVQRLRCAGYSVSWGGNKTFGSVPDLSGLDGVHIECKRAEKLNLYQAMEQASADSIRFGDGAPTVFQRRNNQPWLVTMKFSDWINLYTTACNCACNARAVFFKQCRSNMKKGDKIMKTTKNTNNFWNTEKPMVADTGKNLLEYFPRAKSLSVAKPNWISSTGEERRGKTVLVDLEALKACPEAVGILREIMDVVEGK